MNNTSLLSAPERRKQTGFQPSLPALLSSTELASVAAGSSFLNPPGKLLRHARRQEELETYFARLNFMPVRPASVPNATFSALYSPALSGANAKKAPAAQAIQLNNAVGGFGHKMENTRLTTFQPLAAASFAKPTQSKRVSFLVPTTTPSAQLHKHSWVSRARTSALFGSFDIVRKTIDLPAQQALLFEAFQGAQLLRQLADGGVPLLLTKEDMRNVYHWLLSRTEQSDIMFDNGTFSLHGDLAGLLLDSLLLSHSAQPESLGIYDRRSSHLGQFAKDEDFAAHFPSRAAGLDFAPGELSGRFQTLLFIGLNDVAAGQPRDSDRNWLGRCLFLKPEGVGAKTTTDVVMHGVHYLSSLWRKQGGQADTFEQKRERVPKALQKAFAASWAQIKEERFVVARSAKAQILLAELSERDLVQEYKSFGNLIVPPLIRQLELAEVDLRGSSLLGAYTAFVANSPLPSKRVGNEICINLAEEVENFFTD